MTAFKESHGAPTSHNIIHFSTVLFCNPTKSLPDMTNAHSLNVNLPHAPRIWTLFRKSLHFSFLSSRFPNCSSFSLPPLEIRDTSYISEERKKTQTNHFRLQIQPVSPPAALLSSQVSCTPGCVRAFLCPRRAKPRVCLHARNYAPLGSAVTARTKRRNADEGRTAELSCDSDLLQDLCRAPLPPLCRITLEIPFNSPSLFLWDRGASLPPSNGRSANRPPCPATPPPPPTPHPRNSTSH